MRFAPIIAFSGLAAAGLVQRGDYEAPPAVDTYAPVVETTVDNYAPPEPTSEPVFVTKPAYSDSLVPAATTDYVKPPYHTPVAPPPVISTPTPGKPGGPGGHSNGTATGHLPPSGTKTPSPGQPTDTTVPGAAAKVQASVMALLGLVAAGVFVL